MNTPQFNRRRFLAGTGAAGLAVAGLASLAACGSGTAAKGGAAKSAKFELPVYTAANTAKPDLSGPGLDPTYLRFPKDLVKSVAKAPGDGKKITALTATWTTPAPPMAKNGYWQEVNKRLGSELDMQIVDDNVGDGYTGKFNALTASGDLPELVWFPPGGGNVPRLPELLAAKFHDLTPYLSGDKIKKYPNLANLPTVAWKSAVINGALYGTAVPYVLYGQAYIANTDFWKPVGGLTFSSAQDFLDKAKELLDVKKKKYVLEPAYINAVRQFAHWHGVQVSWAEKNGKLQHMFESDAYAAGLEFGVKVFKANLFWPDANLATAADKVAGGQIGAYVDSAPNAIVGDDRLTWPADVILPFAATADVRPTFPAGAGNLGWTSISKSVPKARIETLLNVLNYLAAPFGTEERQFMRFGVEGTHYTVKNGEPVLTSKGEAEVLPTMQPLGSLGAPPQYVYATGKPERARQLFEIEKKLQPMMVTNPVIGHYSDTATAKNASLTQTMYDLVTDIVSGRKPMSAWKPAVAAWRSGGGDAMRAEYEKSIATNK